MVSGANKARGKPVPPVGVLARTKNIAESWIREMGIRNAMAISVYSDGIQARGATLSALIVDADVWPMTRAVSDAVLPALRATRGDVIKMQRLSAREAGLASIGTPLSTAGLR
jgi:hypothetical protein